MKNVLATFLPKSTAYADSVADDLAGTSVCRKGNAIKSAFPKRTTSGFTLIEMLVVLVIIAALLGALLTPLQTQLQLRQLRDEDNSLDKVESAANWFRPGEWLSALSR